jgi:hypothetical protein
MSLALVEVGQVEAIIDGVNNLHVQFSEEYFKKEGIVPINLKNNISQVDVNYILLYRLDLHESINDYIQRLRLQHLVMTYRVKTAESLLDKISRFRDKENLSVNQWLNDLFGCRKIVSTEALQIIKGKLDEWKEKYGLMSWYTRDKGDGYVGTHIYFKNKNNFYFPWEFQLWEDSNEESNLNSHVLHKRDFARLLHISSLLVNSGFDYAKVSKEI